jgi:hypothetical protein
MEEVVKVALIIHAGAGAAAPSPRGGRVASRVQLVLHAMGGGKGGGKGEGGGSACVTQKARGQNPYGTTQHTHSR